MACAKLFDVGRIVAIDTVPSRLEMARAQGAEVIDFNAEDPIKTIGGGFGCRTRMRSIGVNAHSIDHTVYANAWGQFLDGRPFIRLELFHDTIPSLKTIAVGFDLLSGTTLEQARNLVDAMNERIIGVAVTPK